MNYELAKKLKDAGFPQRPANGNEPYPNYTGYGTGFVYKDERDEEEVYAPTLSELIEACGDAQQGSGFLFLSHNATTPNERWFAEGRLVQEGRITNKSATGSILKEAIANLWLALNKHSPEKEAGV